MRKSMIKHYITERNRELLIKVYLIFKDITTRMGNMFRHNQQGIKSCIYDMTFCGPYRPLHLQNVTNDVSFTLRNCRCRSRFDVESVKDENQCNELE